MTRPTLRLPERLSYTVVGVALACSSGGSPGADAGSDAALDATAETATNTPATDAAPDVGVDATADAADACVTMLYCGPASADAGPCPGYLCDVADCPPGCEPFA